MTPGFSARPTRGDPVTSLETVGEANGHPISVAANYFPGHRFPGLADLYERVRIALEP